MSAPGSGAARDRSALEFWNALAAHWSGGGALAPSAGDLAWYGERAAWLADRPASERLALILGVTPGIAALAWPAGSRVLAVDGTAAMIRRLWQPERVCAPAQAVLGDWRALPVRSASVAFAAGDGSLTAVGTHEATRQTIRELRRVMCHDGRVLLRLFLRPDTPETLDRITQDVATGTPEELGFVRIRLAMLAQSRSGRPAPMDEVWRMWSEHLGEQVRVRLSAEQRGFLDAWRGRRSSLNLATLAETCDMMDGAFSLVRSEPGSGRWGACLLRTEWAPA